MDLNQIDGIVDVDSYDYDVVNPKDQTVLMTLKLAGPTHPKRVALSRKYERKLSQNIQRTQDVRRSLTSSVVEPLNDENVRLERQIEELMVSTLDWSGVTRDGQPLAYDAELMEQLYRSKKWLRDWVQTEINRSENFIGSSAKN